MRSFFINSFISCNEHSGRISFIIAITAATIGADNDVPNPVVIELFLYKDIILLPGADMNTLSFFEISTMMLNPHLQNQHQ